MTTGAVLPVRVAHVVHSLQPGGTERRVLAVIGGLDPARFDPLLICIDELGALADEARALGIEPILVGRSRRADLSGVRRLAAILRRERVAIVQGWLSLPGVYARIAGAAGRVPVRIAAEGGVRPTTDLRRLRAYVLVDRILAPLTDAYLANSEAVAATLRQRGVVREKIVVIPNGVAVSRPLSEEEREQLRRGLAAGAGEELVGMVARLDSRFKDHETFLRSVGALVGEGRPLRAAVIGDGPARGALEQVAARLGIAERVTFTGFRRDAARLVSALDVSVLLSYSEGFSNVVLESMAAGIPLVATAIAPNREAVDDGVEGLLVPVGDLPATVSAVRRLLADRPYADALAAAARRRVRERYSLEAQSARTMELYDRLLERTTTGGTR